MNAMKSYGFFTWEMTEKGNTHVIFEMFIIS
jgi:hypothetical protein